MICPKCGNEVDLFADKCLCCGKSFKSMSLAERQKLEVKPKKVKRTPEKSKPRSDVTQTRVEYNNGIACKEGMSYTGRKMKKGSFKKRPNNEGTGMRIGFSTLGGYYG